jgi:hypothetical protein
VRTGDEWDWLRTMPESRYDIRCVEPRGSITTVSYLGGIMSDISYLGLLQPLLIPASTFWDTTFK